MPHGRGSHLHAFLFDKLLNLFLVQKENFKSDSRGGKHGENVLPLLRRIVSHGSKYKIKG